MQKVRRGLVAMTAACLMMGVAVPAASAAPPVKAQAAASKAGQAKLLAQSAKRNALAARRSAKRLNEFLLQLNTRLKSSEGGLAGILAAAPQLVSGLQALSTAVQTQIAPGLKALSDAVQTQIGPGLTRLGAAYSSVEYGAIRIYGTIGPNTFAIPLTTASDDIPDDGNGSTANATIPMPIGNGAGGTIPSGTAMRVRAAIRSNESDGNATGDPAGQVGALVTVTCAGNSTDPTNLAAPCDLNGAAAGGTVPAGGVVGVLGPPPSKNIKLPDGNIGAFPVVDIQQRSPRTGVVDPKADAVNPLAGASQGSGICDKDAGTCTLTGNPGDLFQYHVQAQFFDIPTSLSPGPTD